MPIHIIPTARTVTAATQALFFLCRDNGESIRVLRSYPSRESAEAALHRCEHAGIYYVLDEQEVQRDGVDMTPLLNLRARLRLNDLQRRVRGTYTKWKPCAEDAEELLARAAAHCHCTNDQVLERLAAGEAVRYGPNCFQTLRTREPGRS